MRKRYVEPFVSDCVFEVAVADPRVTFAQAPPFTWRWSWYEAMPSASQADQAVRTRAVVDVTCVPATRLDEGAVGFGVALPTVRATLVVRVRAPAVPFTVMGKVPRGVAVPQFEVVRVR